MMMSKILKYHRQIMLPACEGWPQLPFLTSPDSSSQAAEPLLAAKESGTITFNTERKVYRKKQNAETIKMCIAQIIP